MLVRLDTILNVGTAQQKTSNAYFTQWYLKIKKNIQAHKSLVFLPHLMTYSVLLTMPHWFHQKHAVLWGMQLMPLTNILTAAL